jgi:hypothetical protein
MTRRHHGHPEILSIMVQTSFRIPGVDNISYPSYTMGRPDSVTFPGGSFFSHEGTRRNTKGFLKLFVCLCVTSWLPPGTS